jgi:hypothetical protein
VARSFLHNTVKFFQVVKNLTASYVARSSSCLRQPATGLCWATWIQSMFSHHVYLGFVYYYPLIYPYCPHVICTIQVLYYNTVCSSHLCCAFYKFFSSLSSPNNIKSELIIWKRVQIVIFLPITQILNYFLSLCFSLAYFYVLFWLLLNFLCFMCIDGNTFL